MSLISYDLVMSHEDMDRASDDIKKEILHLDKKLHEYIRILHEITEDGIIDGKIHENLKVYQESVKKIRSILKEIVLEQVERENKQYPKDFDKADDILF